MRYVHKKLVRQVLKLSIPISLARMLEVSMSTVDTVMVGRLGKDALAAVGIGLPLMNLLAVFFLGTLLAVAPMLGRLRKRGDAEAIGQILSSAKVLSVVFAAFSGAVFYFSDHFFLAMKQPADLVPAARDFLLLMLLGLPALFLNQSLRQIFEVHKMAKITVGISLIAFGLNILGNYALIYGRLGFPKLGIYGSALSTSLCWWWMSAAHVWMLRRIPGHIDYRALVFSRALPSKESLARFLGQGLPFGSAIVAEVSFFVFTAWMIGQLGKVPLASHHIAINLASLTFMVAIGTSHATTVLISQIHGTFHRARALLVGAAGTAVILSFMSLTAFCYMGFPSVFVRIYTNDPELLAFAPKLLFLGGVFQLCDGVQSVFIGILRGLSITKAAMTNTLIAYWIVGIPAGYLMGSVLAWGAQGYWIGLNVGLTAAAILHAIAIRAKLREDRSTEPTLATT